MGLYRKLGEGHEIRLLRLDNPAIIQTQQEIRCHLEVHQLGSSSIPSFSALSYTWGSPHPDPSTLCDSIWREDSQIFCNDTSIQVTENLYNFLHHYTSKDFPGRRAEYIWVDALCIDQENTVEKNNQVGLMAEIYQAATSVIVWLGPSDRLGYHALKLIAGLASSKDDRIRLQPRDVRINHPDYLLDLNYWESLIRFFQRSYFDRVWVIQEVVLAQTAVVLCGNQIMSYDDIGVVSDFLATSVWTNFVQDPRLNPNRRGLKCWHNSPTRVVASRNKRLAGGDDSFLHALIRARKSSSHDPRDKVYSQLGLGNAALQPRYKASVADVYVETAKCVMNQSGSLLVLAYAEGRQSFPDLPSWAPDWTCKDNVGLGITGYPQFHADRDQIPTYNIFRDGVKHILKIRARRLDDIVQICEAKDELRNSLPTSNLWRMMENLSEQYPFNEGQPREEALWRSLVTNRGAVASGGRIQHPVSSDLLQPSFRAWIIWRYALADEEPVSYPSHCPNSTVIPSQEDIKAARVKVATDATYLEYLEHEASYFNFAFSLAMYLRPFRTREGCIGVGAEALQEHDSLWIVPGCRVPLIFRAIEGSTRFRLVGGAYVHGIMKGEALIDRMDNEEIELE